MVINYLRVNENAFRFYNCEMNKVNDVYKTLGIKLALTSSTVAFNSMSDVTEHCSLEPLCAACDREFLGISL